MEPSYLHLSLDKLEQMALKAWKRLNPCVVCPRKCGVDRESGKKLGFCKTGKKVKIFSVHPHFGEEKPLVGTGGSGTIFFSSCNLACIYCQNWEISQLRLGKEIDIDELAEKMIKLQNLGCHNINLVSPTIWAPQIIKAVIIARKKGLKLPLVYNTGGYDSVETLKLLKGIVDIYMPDIKYSDSKTALKYSLVPNYWEVVKKAVIEMHKQVGDLVIDKNGLAQKGLIIRHLILPSNLGGTKKVMRFIASLSTNSYVNIMDQYYPTNKAFDYSLVNRAISRNEYHQAVETAQREGLHRLDSIV